MRRIPSGDDIEMLKWLEHYDINYYIIFTKTDKLSNNQKFKQLKEIKRNWSLTIKMYSFTRPLRIQDVKSWKNLFLIKKKTRENRVKRTLD